MAIPEQSKKENQRHMFTGPHWDRASVEASVVAASYPVYIAPRNRQYLVGDRITLGGNSGVVVGNRVFDTVYLSVHWSN